MSRSSGQKDGNASQTLLIREMLRSAYAIGLQAGGQDVRNEVLALRQRSGMSARDVYFKLANQGAHRTQSVREEERANFLSQDLHERYIAAVYRGYADGWMNGLPAVYHDLDAKPNSVVKSIDAQNRIMLERGNDAA